MRDRKSDILRHQLYVSFTVHKLYMNIVRVVKSRTMKRAGHVARMGEGRGVHRVLVGKP